MFLSIVYKNIKYILWDLLQWKVIFLIIRYEENFEKISSGKRYNITKNIYINKTYSLIRNTNNKNELYFNSNYAIKIPENNKNILPLSSSEAEIKNDIILNSKNESTFSFNSAGNIKSSSFSYVQK